MKKILITGAGSGLGRALTKQFANANTHLILLDISQSGLQDTEQSLDSSVAQIDSYVVDIGDTPSLNICLEQISTTIGHIDWIINCAGITMTSRAIDIDSTQWQKIFAVNVLGVTTIIHHFLPKMLENRVGKIINIASMFGLLPAPSGIAYATSKHALVGYTKTLMIELENTGVSVHLVCPGFIQTDLFENATYIDVDKDNMLPDTSSMMTSQDAAKQIQLGLARNKSWIVFPIYVRILWWIEWLSPTLANYIWRKQWQSFQQKLSS
jgi:short-subunit dehydrogenase